MLLLPHKAFTLQISQNHGLQLFCSTSFAQAPLQQKLAMPLQPLRPAMFCQLSPEAYLPTGKGMAVKKWRCPAELVET